MKVRLNQNRRPEKRQAGKLLPTIAAIGGACGLAAAPAGAIELGALQMESALGQPLKASIAFALAPNEQLFDYCIYLRPGAPGAMIPTVSRARISVAGNRIVLTGNTPVMDPILNVRVAVDCPYTPNVVREFTMIVDPVDMRENPVLVADNTSAQVPRAASRPEPRTANEPPAAAPAATRLSPSRAREAIAMGGSYEVRSGDSISAIAARIEDRPVALATAIDMLVDANPDAFIGGDPNRIMAGSVLAIPVLTAGTQAADVDTTPAYDPADKVSAQAGEPAFVEAAPPAQTDLPVATAPETARPEPASAAPEIPPATAAAATVPESPDALTSAAETMESTTSDVPDVNTADLAAVAEPAAVEESPSTEQDGEGDAGLRPGDIVLGPPAIATSGESVPTVVTTSAQSESGRSWMETAAYAGGALALLGGIFLLGRGLRQRFGSKPINAPEEVVPADDDATATNPVIDDVDFRFGDTMVGDPISLDADLGVGTGLNDSGDLDLAQEFGFDADEPAAREVDLEIPEHAEIAAEDSPTDIIEPAHRESDSLELNAEIIPEQPVGDDYDMSMIVDATRAKVGEYDATARDLQAVEVDGDDGKEDYSVSDNTMTSEVDLAILEQDYEEEFTQTQALNQEIEQAARELAKRLDEDEPSDAVALDFALDPTAEMPARDPADAEMTDDLTANMPIDAEAGNDESADEEITARVSRAGNEPTVEMQVESGKVDTKAGNA